MATKKAAKKVAKKVAKKAERPAEDLSLYTMVEELPEEIGDKLARLCAERRELAVAMGVMAAEDEALKDSITKLAAKAGVEKVRGDGWTLSKVVTTRSSIKPELLLQNGVSMKQIEKSTVSTVSEGYTLRDIKEQA